MNIVVLAGGLSSERDVSLSSGIGICNALKKKGHNVVLLDVFFGYGDDQTNLTGLFEQGIAFDAAAGQIMDDEPDLEEVYKSRGGDSRSLLGPNVIEICRMADIVYMGLHGAEGENGKLQAMFDVLGIRYTGSGYLGSAVAMDKGMAKKIFQAGSIPTPKGFCVTRETAGPVPEAVGFPCVVKPCCGGSSVGVSIASDEEEYKRALETAFRFEDEVLVEEYIQGREFSVGIVSGEVLPIIEIIPKEGFFDYKTKYQPGMSQDVCPAELDEAVAQKMQGYALAVYRELKLKNYGRIDFLLAPDGKMYCLEANTLPGMTAMSLLPQEAKAAGIDYETLCERIVMDALKA